MILLNAEILLCAVCLTVGQITHNKNTYIPLNYEDIARIVQAPLFRRNPVASSERISSYLPQGYDTAETKKLNIDSQVDQSDSPSLVLEVPKPDAVDSYSYHKDGQEQTQIVQTLQPNPYIQSKQFQGVEYTPKQFIQEPPYIQYVPFNPHSKQLDLSIPNVHKVREHSSELATDLQPPAFGAINYYHNTDFTKFGDILAEELTPPHPNAAETFQLPKSESIKPFQVPTIKFPKKYYTNVHEPIPKKNLKDIHEVEVIGEDLVLKKVVKPQRVQSLPINEAGLFNKNLGEEKIRQKYEESLKKQQAKKENEFRKQRQLADVSSGESKEELSAESTRFNAYNAPRHAPNHGLKNPVDESDDGDRTQFQMHGQHGPHSYKFGYDTGKGKNRQFRYEERDNDGHVKGHYGFYDKQGKLQVVNYDAHPHHGFHAEGSFGKA